MKKFHVLKRGLSILLVLSLVFELGIFSNSIEYVYAETETVTESTAKTETTAATEDEDDTIMILSSDSSSAEDMYESDLIVEKIDGLDEDFIMGVDVSSVIALENSGVTYYDEDGNEEDLFVILAEAGVSYIRVRVWNDPYDEDGNAYGGGNNDLAVAEAIGKRATAAGLKLYVDFHYSDFWADPSKQTRPKAWTSYSTSEIVDAVTEFTTESLETLYADGIDIGMVQVGNETTSKFIGASSGTTAYYSYFVAGCDAVRAFSDKYDLGIKVAVHWTNPNSQNFATVCKNLIANGVDFDIFASSYYPAWHGTIANVQSKLNAVKTTYGKDVMIAETAYPYQYETDTSTYTYGVSVQAQATYMHDLIEAMSEIGAVGVFYWEPAWINTSSSDWNEYGTGWASIYAKDYDSEVTSAGSCTTTNTALFKAKGSSGTNRYKFQALESLNVFKYVYKGTTACLEITDYEVQTVEVGMNETVILPDTVSVTYATGNTDDLSVTWDTDSLESIDTSAEGEYTISGTVIGGDNKEYTVYCIVEVSDIYIVYVEDVEVSAEMGTELSYPETVTAKRSNGTTSEVSVIWDETQTGKISTDVTGEYTVSGTVDGYDSSVYCKVSVYVTGEDLVTNGSFEDANGSSGNLRDIPDWNTSSSKGTSSDWGIYTQAKNPYEGSRDLSIWSGTYDNYDVEAYQEIDISEYGAGVYTVSLYASGNISEDSLYVYVKDGDYDSEIAGQSVINQDSSAYVNTTFTVTITNSETLTIGIVGEGVAKSAWANIDCVEVNSPGSYTTSDAEQLEALVSSVQSYIADSSVTETEELTTALAAAQSVLSSESATESEIAEALAALEEAMNNTSYSIKVSDASNGTVAVGNTVATAGETVTLDIQADDIYELYSLKIIDENLQEIETDGTSFVMPASPVTVTAIFKLEDKYINQTTLHYYYSGSGNPAVVFDSEIDGTTCDFTIDGKYGYYMESDAVSGDYWYKYKIKELYGSFYIYIVSGDTYTLKTTYTYGESSYESLIAESDTYLFRGTLYYSLGSVEGLDQLDAPEVEVADSTTVSTVRLTWEAVTGATGYTVYRNGTYLKYVTATAAVDNTVKEDTEYTYYVIASDSTGTKENSDASNTVSAMSPDFAVTKATRNGTTITISWEELSNADGYVIQRSTDGSTFTTIKTVTSGSTVKYSDKSKKVSQAYYYKVIPYKISGSGKVWGASNEVYLAAVKFSAPSSVKAVRSNTTKIKITWKKASNATGYVIKRSTKKNSGYKTIKTITSNTKSSYSYTNSGVKTSKTYYYRVLSYKTVGSKKVYSSYSTKTVKKVTVSSAVSKNVKLKKLSSKKVKISWRKVSNCTGYVIYRSTKKSSGYKKIKTISSYKTVSYTDKTVKKGKTYYYKIKTYKKVGSGKIYGKATTAKKIKVK